MIAMARTPGWRQRLAEFLSGIHARPFSWDGDGECFLGLVVPAIKAQTGVDIGAAWRGCYSTPETALAAIQARGYANLADAMADILPEIPPSRAAFGDVAAIAIPGDPLGFSFGIVLGERIQVLSPGSGGTVRLMRAARAFRVG